MAVVSDTALTYRRRDARLSLRIPHDAVGRIDVLAAHCGHGRSDFIRVAIELADTVMTLASLEAASPLTPDRIETRRAARERLAVIKEVLSPTTLD